MPSKPNKTHATAAGVDAFVRRRIYLVQPALDAFAVNPEQANGQVNILR